EFFGVTLTTHGTSYLGLIMRLGGVYETRGDSRFCLLGLRNKEDCSTLPRKAAKKWSPLGDCVAERQDSPLRGAT
ncbi:hypothetical protein, partial [Pseudomonas juntendi]|uniref:hypothetical protein n=1 Tax=Pseudomonas juntendi TaxID=2666183 RepID=UPI003B43CDD6